MTALHRVKSHIGRCAARVNLAEGNILIALRAYLDSSGKLGDGYMTLAAVAANDQIWEDFEKAWDRILKGYTPKASYIHMREIAHQQGGFDRKLGWNNNNAFGLATTCLSYMSAINKKMFKMFYCAVDLKAWRKLRDRNYQMPEPVEMCNRFCSE